ncbi:MAG: hypothetical protein HY863_21290 [Chloroflexi bacterium]|nr:hypothetical protein [Chloroflexota bacterium]
MRRNYRIFSFLIVTALILACAPTLAPVSTPASAFDPNSVNTAIVLTAAAAATQTALLQPPTLTPTVTLLPTNTFLPSETPTATFIFILPTSTVPSPTPTPEPTQDGGSGNGGGAQYACRIDSQSPADNAVFAPGADFDATWQVTNTGSDKWDVNSSDYRYISGDKIHKTSAYDFSKTVGVGKTTNIIVDMKAPGNSGTYSTTWKISIGKTKFCTMKLTIVVQ